MTHFEGHIEWLSNFNDFLSKILQKQKRIDFWGMTARSIHKMTKWFQLIYYPYSNQVDEVFRNRWRTLISVDDLVENVFTKLSDENLLENTIALYTSDHGYHLGNYGLPLDKRMPYDTGWSRKI